MNPDTLSVVDDKPDFLVLQPPGSDAKADATVAMPVGQSAAASNPDIPEQSEGDTPGHLILDGDAMQKEIESRNFFKAPTDTNDYPSYQKSLDHFTKFIPLYGGIDKAIGQLPAESRTELLNLVGEDADRDEQIARILNQCFVAHYYKDSDVFLPEDNWLGVRDGVAHKLPGWRPDMSELEVYHLIGKNLQDIDTECRGVRTLTAKLFEQALEGQLDFDEALKAAGGFTADESRKPFYDNLIAATYERITAELSPRREFAQKLQHALWLRASVGDVERGWYHRVWAFPYYSKYHERKDAAEKELEPLILQLKSMSEEERNIIYELAKQLPSPARAEEFDTTVRKSEKNLVRGAVDVGIALKTLFHDAPNQAKLEKYFKALDDLTVPAQWKHVGWSSWDPPEISMLDALLRDGCVTAGAREKYFGIPVRWPNRRKPHRMLTDAEKQELRTQITDRLHTMTTDMKVYDELRALEEKGIDPVVGDNFFAKYIWYPTVRATPQIGLSTIPYAGPPLLFTITAGSRTKQMMDRGVEPGRAMGIGVMIAIPETILDRVKFEPVLKKVPFIRKIFELPSSVYKKLFDAPESVAEHLIVRAGERFIKNAASANATNALQDLCPLAIMHVASQLDQSMPEINWRNEFKHYGAGRVETFWTILPMVLIGTGAGTAADIRYLHDPTYLRSVGFSETAIKEITAVTDADTTCARIQDAWNDPSKRNPESAEAQTARADLDAILSAQTNAVIASALTDADGNVKFGPTPSESFNRSINTRISEQKLSKALNADQTIAHADSQAVTKNIPASLDVGSQPIEAASTPRHATDIVQARQAAGEFVNQPLINAPHRVETRISNDAAKNIFSDKAASEASNPQAYMQAIANLDYIYENAIRIEGDTPSQATRGNRAYDARYIAPMEHRGQAFGVIITAAERVDAHGTTQSAIKRVEIVKDIPTTEKVRRADAAGTIRKVEHPVGPDSMESQMQKAIEPVQATLERDAQIRNASDADSSFAAAERNDNPHGPASDRVRKPHQDTAAESSVLVPAFERVEAKIPLADTTLQSTKAWAQKNLPGTETNNATKQKIEITTDFLDKTIEQSGHNPTKLMALEHLPHLLRDGVILERDTTHAKPEAGSRRKYALYAPYVLDGEGYIARIVIEEAGSLAIATELTLKSLAEDFMGSGSAGTPNLKEISDDELREYARRLFQPNDHTP